MGAGREREKELWDQAFKRQSWQSCVGVASLSHLSSLWSGGAVPSCLLPGPGVIGEGGGTPNAKPSKEDGWGHGLWISGFAYERRNCNRVVGYLWELASPGRAVP